MGTVYTQKEDLAMQLSQGQGHPVVRIRVCLGVAEKTCDQHWWVLCVVKLVLWPLSKNRRHRPASQLVCRFRVPVIPVKDTAFQFFHSDAKRVCVHVYLKIRLEIMIHLSLVCGCSVLPINSSGNVCL